MRFTEDEMTRIVQYMDAAVAKRIEEVLNTRIEAMIQDKVKAEIRQIFLTLAELKK